MNIAALRHTPLSEDAHALDETHVVFRLRTARGDVPSCTLRYGDRACRQNPVPMHSAPMTIVAQDVFFDYHEVTLALAFERICYAFELSDGQQTCYYYADRQQEGLSVERSHYYQLPFVHRADIARVPGWAEDAVVYNVFVDSYATARRMITPGKMSRVHEGVQCHGKNGGTLRGILENLDDIERLGFNCLYLNPIFAAEAYHKYDTVDYYHIDPCFGTDDDFRALVDACHGRGMRIIIDGVFNHTGRHFFAFADVLKNGDASPYVDWFYHLPTPAHYPDTWDEIPAYTCFGYERHMPKLNTENPEVVAYFCEVGRHWVHTYGIDGWRLDVASEVNDAFWRAFRRAVKDENPDCLLIGEIWESAQHWLDGSQFDSTMNYDLRRHCARFFAEGSIDAYAFDDLVTQMRMRYRKQMLPAQLNLLDSHDVSRFLSLCHGDTYRFQLAVLFLMTFVGMPCVFYGDERGLFGIEEDAYRQPMPWAKPEDDLYLFYQQAIALRRAEPALRQGTFCTVYAKPRETLYGYQRKTAQDTITIWLEPDATKHIPQACKAGSILMEAAGCLVTKQSR